MPLYTADALILRTYKLGEADRIVVFLTSDRGKRRGVAKGARRTRSRFSGGLEPFTRVRLAYFERENRDLVRLSYTEPVVSPLVGQAAALTQVEYFAELMDAWAPEADPSERLYRLGASVIDAIAANVPVEALARYFEYWLLRLQGVYPSIMTCNRCGKTLAQKGAVLASNHGVFVCWNCASGNYELKLSAEALGFLQAVSKLGADQLSDLSLAPPAARQLAEVHRQLITMQLEREPRSTRVLRELGSSMDRVETERSSMP